MRDIESNTFWYLEQDSQWGDHVSNLKQTAIIHVSKPMLIKTILHSENRLNSSVKKKDKWDGKLKMLWQSGAIT
jgi:adenine specific DNA methylase Mod